MVGKPMPRLTNAPSGMSRATRAAIWSRVYRFMAVSSCRGLWRRQRVRDIDLYHALDEDARRDDVFRIQCAERHDLAYLDDRALRRRRHDGPEVARRLAIDQIAPAVAQLRLDQGEV